MSDFYKMADELREALRKLFPNGVRMCIESGNDGYRFTVNNYNDFPVEVSFYNVGLDE